MNHQWFRVTKACRCPVCEHADWCSVCPELNLVLCMRIASDRASKNSMGGYLHKLNGEKSKLPVHFAPAAPVPTIDCAAILKSWTDRTHPDTVRQFAVGLGVSEQSLFDLGCCRSASHPAFAFPMRDGASQIIGIRLRFDDGQKRAVRGSRSGLFIPDVAPKADCYVTEGESDCAAAMTMGLFSIGRPSCSGGVALLWLAMRERRVRRVIICADNDPDKYRPDGERYNPGIDGAKRLSEELNLPTCILVPPTKDLRDFVQCGGNSELIDSMLQSLVWHVPTRETVEHGDHFTDREKVCQDDSPFA